MMDSPGAVRPPRVSAIIIFRDAEAFLDEAIHSVLRQTFPHWELILVDDASHDRSAAIAREHVHRQPERIRLLALERGQGMSAARNLGVRHARGDLVAFLDADDVWLPHKLERQVEALDQNPDVAMVYGNSIMWYGDEGDFVRRVTEVPRRILAPPAAVEVFLDGANPTTCASLIRKSALESVGGLEDTFNGLNEDLVLYTKLGLRFPVMGTSDCVDKYRQHPRSFVARSTRREVRRRHVELLQWLVDHLAGDPMAADLRARMRSRLRWSRLPVLSPLWKGLRGLGIPGRLSRSRRARAVLRRLLPDRTYRWLRGLVLGGRYSPWPRPLALGDLRRTTPVDHAWGSGRGTPIDRHYIEGFLARNAGAVAGRVLEVGDDRYTRRHGGERVTHRDVLHVNDAGPGVTLVADLEVGAGLPDEAFDCMIVTQTLQCVHDVRAAIRTLHRISRLGGVVLVTVPGITRVAREPGAGWGQHWTFTELSLRRLFGEVFGDENVTIESHGNVLSAVAFLHGMAMEELDAAELDARDEDYPVILTIRANRA